MAAAFPHGTHRADEPVSVHLVVSPRCSQGSLGQKAAVAVALGSSFSLPVLVLHLGAGTDGADSTIARYGVSSLHQESTDSAFPFHTLRVSCEVDDLCSFPQMPLCRAARLLAKCRMHSDQSRRDVSHARAVENETRGS